MVVSLRDQVPKGSAMLSYAAQNPWCQPGLSNHGDFNRDLEKKSSPTFLTRQP